MKVEPSTYMKIDMELAEIYEQDQMRRAYYKYQLMNRESVMKVSSVTMTEAIDDMSKGLRYTEVTYKFPTPTKKPRKRQDGRDVKRKYKK